MAALVGSATSATSRAEPAVSAATIGVRPRRRMARRHWPRAITWLSTVRRSEIRVPGIPSSWWRMGRKCSPMIASPETGSRW